MLFGVIGSGLYIALSPCLFPLLPLFLVNSLQTTDTRKRSLVVTGVLVAGILVSLGLFAIMAYAVSSIGLFFLSNFTILQAILGSFIFFFGLVMISERLRNILHMSRLSMRGHPDKPSNLTHVFSIGLGYTLMAAPCAGPSILAMVSIFGVQSNPVILILMFILVAIVIAIPYFTIALVTGEARIRLTMSMSKRARSIEIAVGAILLILGVILITPVFGYRIFL